MTVRTVHPPRWCPTDSLAVSEGHRLERCGVGGPGRERERL
jgi:hypothetical protein